MSKEAFETIHQGLTEAITMAKLMKENERLCSALKLITTSESHNAAIQLARIAIGSVCKTDDEANTEHL